MTDMASLAESSDQTVVLDNISWETYERLLAARGDSPAPRFHYNSGVLEIMSPSLKHETVARAIERLIGLLAEELDVDFLSAGSTTFKRKDLAKGFEPDSCFYIQNVTRIRGKEEIDLTTDPPPDLAIEVESARSAVDKLALYAAAGVPEVWRYRKGNLTIYELRDGSYVESTHSPTFSRVSSSQLSEFVQSQSSMTSPAWARTVRLFAQSIKKA